jgi:hypothetical protein
MEKVLKKLTSIHRCISAVAMFAGAFSFGMSASALAERFDTKVPMYDKGAATFYVDSHLSGLGDMEMLVDTGSGYLAINEVALKTIAAQGKATYVKQLRGVLANGKEMVVPVYRVESLRIGKECWIHDVQAAVFPGNNRLILGLSALSKASPFIFETDPPQLTLSNCGKPKMMAAEMTNTAKMLTEASQDKKRLAAVIEP